MPKLFDVVGRSVASIWSAGASGGQCLGTGDRPGFDAGGLGDQFRQRHRCLDQPEPPVDALESELSGHRLFTAPGAGGRGLGVVPVAHPSDHQPLPVRRVVVGDGCVEVVTPVDPVCPLGGVGSGGAGLFEVVRDGVAPVAAGVLVDDLHLRLLALQGADVPAGPVQTAAVVAGSGADDLAVDDQVGAGLIGPADGLSVGEHRVVDDQVTPPVAAVGLVDDLQLRLLTLVGGQVHRLPVQRPAVVTGHAGHDVAVDQHGNGGRHRAVERVVPAADEDVEVTVVDRERRGGDGALGRVAAGLAGVEDPAADLAGVGFFGGCDSDEVAGAGPAG